MIIRMVHPQHGATHVYDTVELERHRALGWLTEEAAKPPTVDVSRDALIPAVSLDELRDEMAPAKRKPGRPRKVQ